MPKVIWVLVSCQTEREARQIGKAVLAQRLAACAKSLDQEDTWYFWPARAAHLTHQDGGALLVLETLAPKYRAIAALVRKLHSDKLPSVGYLEIKGTSKELLAWIRESLRPAS
ncbi:divalent-cation tolerance protein CutA [Candidatus Uhrbacteria bacterium]|nr:divalent-cation tolerance protein CutA [Candidatus Uhrbacteria bacterium]